jgi:hypothetical protein
MFLQVVICLFVTMKLYLLRDMDIHKLILSLERINCYWTGWCLVSFDLRTFFYLAIL